MARTAIAATFAASVTTLIVSGAHSADHAATSRGALPANEVPAWIPSMFETSGQTNKVLVQGRGTLSVEHQIPILHRRVIFFSLFFVPEVLFVAERRGLCLRFFIGSTAPPFRSLYVRCLMKVAVSSVLVVPRRERAGRLAKVRVWALRTARSIFHCLGSADHFSSPKWIVGFGNVSFHFCSFAAAGRGSASPTGIEVSLIDTE